MNDQTPQLRRVQTACLMILTALALSCALYFFSSVLIPFVLAVFLYYALSPVIMVQVHRLRLPRSLALVSTVLLACILLGAVGFIIVPAVAEVRANSDLYQQQMQDLIEKAVHALPLQRFGIETAELKESIYSIPGRSARAILTTLVSQLTSVVSNGLLVLIFLVFLLAGKHRANASRAGVLGDIESRIKRYVITLLATSAATGVLVGLTLGLLHVSFAYMFGFLAFLLNFIPNIGSIVATLLPVPVILLSPDLSWPARIAAVAIPTAIQFGIGNLLQPKLMGRSLDLHPVSVLLGLIFFGLIWGVVGMFLATPILGVVKILLERFEFTRSVGALLAGRLDSLRR